MKSWVSLEKKVCVVCAQEYETGAILMDKRVKETLEHYTVTGPGLCEEHQRLHDSGYVALVECDPEKSTMTDGRIMRHEDAYRTGRFVHLKRKAALEFMMVQPGDVAGPLVYVNPEVIDYLLKLRNQREARE